MNWAEIISASVALIAAIVIFSVSKVVRTIFWQSVKHPRRKVEIEVQGSEIRIKST